MASIIWLSHRGICSTVRVSFFDSTIGIFPHPRAIWVKNVFLATGVLYGFDAVLFYPLDCTISENALLLAISKNALNGSIRETLKENIIRELKQLTLFL